MKKAIGTLLIIATLVIFSVSALAANKVVVVPLGNGPNIGKQDIIPSTTDQTIKKGYHDGSGTCKGDPELVPENIPVGVTLFGVVGTLTAPILDRGNGTITISATGLMWQKADDGHVYNWYEAAGEYHASYNPTSIDVCGDLDLGGHSDWRLPTQDELRSLIVCTNGNGPIVDYPYHPYYCGDGNAESHDSPTIDELFSCQFGVYWSSSVVFFDDAWRVNFNDGYSYWSSRTSHFYVRCVR